MVLQSPEVKSHKGLILPGDPEFVRKPSGHMLVDGQEVAVTRQCCHCGRHFVSIRGSGHIRGFCRNCMKVTCGLPKCDHCRPYRARFDG